jgi:hypothetical protein
MSKVKEPKLKPIGDISATILRLVLGFTKGQLTKKIEQPDVRDGVLLAFPLAQTIIDVLNDKDPENDKQVREALFAHLNGPTAEFLDRILDQKITPIEDYDLRFLLLYIKNKAIEAMQIVTDDDIENKKQLDAFWDQLLRSPDFHAVLIEHVIKPLVRKTGSSEEWVQFIVDIVRATLDGLLKVQEAQFRAKLAELPEA